MTEPDRYRDEPEELIRLRFFAAEGNAQAQWELGKRYSDGRDVPKNLRKAARWYSRAAKQGHVEARFYLGNCYLHGWGVKKNEERARRLFRMAADQGHSGAADLLRSGHRAIIGWLAFVIGLFGGVFLQYLTGSTLGLVFGFLAASLAVLVVLKV